MGNKKDFAGINTGRVYGQIETATSKKGQQGSASPQEQEMRAAELRTQGRKGCKAPRINMAFTTENYQFIKILARASGHTMTEFTNLVIAAYRNEHPEILEKANEFLATINSGKFSELLDPDNGEYSQEDNE